MCQANLNTATWVTSAVVAMPPSTGRGGLLAWTIAPSQVRQAYFGKIVRFTRTKAGTTSESLARLRPDPMQCAGAAGADRGLGLDHLLAARQMLGKRADVAQRRPAGAIHLALGPALIVGGRWRRGGPDGQIIEIERELGDVDDGGLLGSCPEEEILQGPHDRSQALVFRIQRQHQRNQTSRVGGHILRAERHAPNYLIRARFTIQISQFTPPEEAFAPVAVRPSSNRDHQPVSRIARRSIERPRPGSAAR